MREAKQRERERAEMRSYTTYLKPTTYRLKGVRCREAFLALFSKIAVFVNDFYLIPSLKAQIRLV